MDARWSKSHTWSKPDSSAMRHTARKASTVVSWPESFSPNRSGCVMTELFVETSWPHKDGDAVLLGKDLWRPVEAFDEVPVFADIGRDLVGRRMSRRDPGCGVHAHHVIPFLVGIEVEVHLRVGLDVAHLLAGHRVD